MPHGHTIVKHFISHTNTLLFVQTMKAMKTKFKRRFSIFALQISQEFSSMISTVAIIIILKTSLYLFSNHVHLFSSRVQSRSSNIHDTIVSLSLGGLADTLGPGSELGQLPPVLLELRMAPGRVSSAETKRGQGVKGVSLAEVLVLVSIHLEVYGRGAVPVLHHPGLVEGVAGRGGDIGVTLVVHHGHLGVLLWLQKGNSDRTISVTK